MAENVKQMSETATVTSGINQIEGVRNILPVNYFVILFTFGRLFKNIKCLDVICLIRLDCSTYRLSDVVAGALLT